MAEVVGVVASVLTLCKVVSGGVALARGLSNVAAEVKTLEEQLQNLQTILRTVDAAGNACEQPVLAGPLARLRSCMRDLHILLDTKLLRQSRGTTKVRRTAWIRHKGRIVALSESLQSAHEGLHLALTTAILLSTRQLASATQPSSSKVSRIAADGATFWIVRENGTVAEELRIHYPTPQQLQITAPEGSPAHIQQLPWHPDKYPEAELLRLPLRSRRPDSNGTVAMEVDTTSNSSAARVQVMAVEPAALQLPAQPRQNQGPWTGLATMPGEAYTTVSLTPRLVGHCEYEVATTQFSRTNRYSMFYTKSPRHWIRLEISLTVSVESRFWLACQATPRDKHAYKRRFHGLPETLLSQLQTFLEARKNLGQDIHLNVYVGSAGLASPTICASKPSFDAGAYLKRKWEKLFHMGCPYFKESGVAQGPSKTPSNNRDFLANLGSCWMLEHRFGAEKAAIKHNLNSLKILHCLSGTPGIRRFLGVVLDDTTGTMKSFLTEIPGGGRIVRHLGPSVSWARRERWCRQVVEVVAAVHSKGFVVGKLGSLLGTWIDLDGDDNVVIPRFSKTFRQNPGCTAMVPPECRSRSGAGYTTATPLSDVYHMGIQLFVIAANIQNSDPLELCNRIGRGDPRGKVCPGHGDGSPNLPLADMDGIPDSLVRVINACLSGKNARPAAWQVLKEFPSPPCQLDGTPVVPAKPMLGPCLRDKQTAVRTPRNKFCSYCRESTVSSRFFHCTICSYNFYDLCPGCFDKGAHCEDSTHYLREHWMGRQEMGKLYSCVKETGLREVIDL